MTRRSRGRAYLALARVSNLPTVWTNVLAGAALGAAAIDWRIVVASSVALSLLYTGGMFLNDAFDHRVDAVQRPDRPIPAGEVSPREAFGVGFAFLVAGVLLTAAASPPALPWAAALAGCIVLYDWRHKQNPMAPLVMAACRGLVYPTAAAAAGVVAASVLAGGAVMMAYVAGVTMIARYGRSLPDRTIAWLIAGISLVDAAAIAWTGSYALAAGACAGFPLTLMAQRWVRGT